MNEFLDFEITERIREIEVIAVGSRIRDIARLRKRYGRGRWRKLKGIATVAPTWETAEIGLKIGHRRGGSRTDSSNTPSALLGEAIATAQKFTIFAAHDNASCILQSLAENTDKSFNQMQNMPADHAIESNK